MPQDYSHHSHCRGPDGSPSASYPKKAATVIRRKQPLRLEPPITNDPRPETLERASARQASVVWEQSTSDIVAQIPGSDRYALDIIVGDVSILLGLREAAQLWNDITEALAEHDGMAAWMRSEARQRHEIVEQGWANG